MATKAIQTANTFIVYNDTNYNKTDTFGSPSGNFTLVRISDGFPMCTVYNEAIVDWNTIDVSWVTTRGQHLQITLP